MKYEFSSAGEELRDFTWGDLADWYLEIAKIEKPRPLDWAFILGQLLLLWHPFMPFITEYIWQIANFKGLCMLREWPRGASHPMYDREYRDFEKMRALIVDVRRLRAGQGIEPVKFIKSAVMADEEIQNLVERNMLVIKSLARLESIDFVDSIAEGWATAVSGMMTIGLDLAGTIDVEAEKSKMQKE
ncbi:MAG: class I tRNA ligase family protein, partial [Patescibacteria group bacterium]